MNNPIEIFRRHVGKLTVKTWITLAIVSIVTASVLAYFTPVNFWLLQACFALAAVTFGPWLFRKYFCATIDMEYTKTNLYPFHVLGLVWGVFAFRFILVGNIAWIFCSIAMFLLNIVNYKTAQMVTKEFTDYTLTNYFAVYTFNVRGFLTSWSVSLKLKVIGFWLVIFTTIPALIVAVLN